MSVDHLTQPLNPTSPVTWRGREDRVAWVLHNFSRGERAMLARMILLDEQLAGNGVRGYLEDLERQERKALAEAK